MDVNDTVAIVTGGGSGIGRAAALALARAGSAAIVVADIDEQGAGETVRIVREVGAVCWHSPTDVAEVAQMRRLFAAVEARHGGIDIVHNNAGIMSGDPAWPCTSPEQLERVVAINLTAAMVGTRLGIDAMRRRGGGAIVNSASRAALSTNRYDPAYHATKAALTSFTQSCRFLGEEEHIRVNAVLPGIVDTAILANAGDGSRTARWLEPLIADVTRLAPEDIADVVLELVRDDVQTGQCIVVDNPPAGRSRVGDWAEVFRSFDVDENGVYNAH